MGYLARWCCHQKYGSFNVLTHNKGGLGKLSLVCLISSIFEQHRLKIMCRPQTPVYYEVVTPQWCQDASWQECQLIYTVSKFSMEPQISMVMMEYPLDKAHLLKFIHRPYCSIQKYNFYFMSTVYRIILIYISIYSIKRIQQIISFSFHDVWDLPSTAWLQ
jgi:hypothetical protein